MQEEGLDKVADKIIDKTITSDTAGSQHEHIMTTIETSLEGQMLSMDTACISGVGLSKVLNVLNLTDKYPGGITCSDMYRITKSSLFDEQPNSHKDLANYFLHKIAKYNYTARELHLTEGLEHRSSPVQKCKKSKFRQKMEKCVEKVNVMEVSPMDVIIAVFLCCDDICKQDLVSHMWSCRLAVPLIIQENVLSSQPSCFLWPLRSLVMRWETEVNEEHCVREGRLVKEAVTSIAFIRFGEVSVSKSALINSVISGSEKTHSIFMNRDSPGSTKYRHLVDGMIDIGWYFPTSKSEPKHHGCFHDAVMFLNLHGNAYKFQSQLELLSKLANTITVLCKVTDFDRCRNILKSYVDEGNTFLIMLTDQKIKTEDEAVIDDVLDYLAAKENQLQFVEVLDTNKAELLKETRFKLSLLSKGKCVRLEDILTLNVRVSIDEKIKDQLESKGEALVVSDMVRKTPYQDRKHIHIPLQGDSWIAWAKADKDRLRTTNKGRNEDVESYMAERKKIMKKCRLQQKDILQKGANNTLLQLFLKSVNTDNDRKRKLFLRWLKYELDDLSREELRPVYKRYQQIMKTLTSVEEQVKVTQKFELEKLDKEVTLLYFGLEHVLREMGQAYEALMDNKGSPIHRFNYNLPDLAAKILLDGYPFELLDGHVNSVPICWVKDVLNAVERALQRKQNVKEVRTKVISTLGIQSSGKSTMLNVLFGCQYAVSAGRCTRGAYCQFIEVDERCRELLGFDLILAIDTEGLRAPELSAGDQMVKHDNELSTFVIGLAHITILNLMGENTTYLDELLPISVHAFLRMEMATHFKPKCVIIHQNVNKEDDEKLLNQGRILEEKLNKMTQLASNAERAETKSFNDIIDFDVSRDVFYVSALLEGIQPMAPISTRYTEDLHVFKQVILKRDDKVQKSLASFIKHLVKLWSNIKRDDFVYQFRNTIETEARRKLDDFWCHANCSFRQPINTTVETGYVKLQNCTDINQLQGLVELLKSDFKRAIDEEYQNQKCTFQRFLDDADKLLKDTMMGWLTDMEKRFDNLRTDLEKETSAKLGEFEQDKKRTFSLRQSMLGYEQTLKEEIEELVSVVKSRKHTPVSELEIFSLFEEHWKKWTSKIIRENPRNEARITIAEDAEDAILRSFPNGRDSLTKYLKKKPIDSYDRCDFDVNKIVSTTSPVSFFSVHSNYKELIQDLEKDVFDEVDAKLETQRLVRPYAKAEIYELVILVKEILESKQNITKTNTKHDVYFAVLVCGHAIKRLRKFHEEYESQNNLGNVLESLKEHYFGVFKSLFNETERLNQLANNLQKILKKGILKKITRAFPEKIVISMENDSFIRRRKSWTMLTLLIDTATNGSLDDFDTLIRRPKQSISCYISKLVDNYFKQNVNPLHYIFNAALSEVRQHVSLILENTFAFEKKNFETWLKTLQKNAEAIIVLENIDRQNDLGKNKNIDLELLHEKLKTGLEGTVSVISNDMQSYLIENGTSFKTEVVEQIMKTIIGCTESCPFCGAVCMVAEADHKGNHYTTLHRPRGCNRWHDKDTNVLATLTCPMSVASKTLLFRHMQNDKEMWCFYSDYKTIYPEWDISADETGEETSFWNWFFAQYAKEIAGKDLVVPEIPKSWKELDKETEIDKLRSSM